MEDLAIETPELADAGEVGECAGGMGLDEGGELVGTIDDVPFRKGEECLVRATGVAGQGLKFFFTSRPVVSVVDGLAAVIGTVGLTGGW